MTISVIDEQTKKKRKSQKIGKKFKRSANQRKDNEDGHLVRNGGVK